MFASSTALDNASFWPARASRGPRFCELNPPPLPPLSPPVRPEPRTLLPRPTQSDGWVRQRALARLRELAAPDIPERLRAPSFPGGQRRKRPGRPTARGRCRKAERPRRGCRPLLERVPVCAGKTDALRSPRLRRSRVPRRPRATGRAAQASAAPMRSARVELWRKTRCAAKSPAEEGRTTRHGGAQRARLPRHSRNPTLARVLKDRGVSDRLRPRHSTFARVAPR